MIAKAGLEGLSISPSMLHDLKIKEMLNLSMASEGPTGPVLRVAMTECKAGWLSIFSAKIKQNLQRTYYENQKKFIGDRVDNLVLLCLSSVQCC